MSAKANHKAIGGWLCAIGLGVFFLFGVVSATAQAQATSLEGEASPEAEITPAPGDRMVSIIARQADIRGILVSIAEQADLDLVMDAEIRGQITLEITEVTVREALDAVVPPAGFHYALEDGLLKVHGALLETRLFTLNYMVGIRMGTTQLSASSGSAGGGSSGEGGGGSGGGESQSGSQISSAMASDPWAEIAKGLNMIVFGASSGGEGDGTGGERLVVHPPSGVILVTATKDVLLRVAEFLEQIEGSSHRQVIVEARIVEVALDHEYQMGIDWTRIPGTGTDISSVAGNDDVAVAQTLNPGNEVFQIAASFGEFNSLLDALDAQGDLKVISSPRVATLNNQKAVIKVAREETFFTVQVEYEYLPDGSSRPVVSVDPERITIGLILDVTPQISSTGDIMMHIHPSLTELVGEDVFPPGATGADIQANAPILDIREVDTVVRVRDGKMLIIGGLEKDRESEKTKGVPILSSIPLLGHLFRHTTTITEKVELVILLKPTLVIGSEANQDAIDRLDELLGEK